MKVWNLTNTFQTYSHNKNISYFIPFNKTRNNQQLLTHSLTLNLNCLCLCSLVARITKNYNTKFTDDGYVCPNDPKYSSYQINMTRALGHKVFHSFFIRVTCFLTLSTVQILSTFGIVPIPTISRFQLDSTLDQHLVLASDG